MSKSAAAQPSRLVLVGPPRGRGPEPLRRFRLARLRVEGDVAQPGREERFTHLRRTYD